MKKWFQCFIDADGEDESFPMRFDPDTIKGIRRWTTHTTLIRTTIGDYKVSEEYEKFCKRLFAFVNFEEYIKMTNPSEETTTTTTKKKYVVKVKKSKSEEELAALQDYYDNNQPETNVGMYV